MTHQLPDRAEIARSGHESQSRPGPGPTIRALVVVEKGAS